MKLKSTLFILLVSLTINSFGQRTVNYLRTNDYNRLQISIQDFKRVISSIQYYYKETPQDSIDQYRTFNFRCNFSKRGKALSVSSFKQVAELEFNGEYFTDIVLIYSWDSKPISEVTLYLNNSYRKLSVYGTDEKKVEALYRDIDHQLQSSETTLAWINWDMTFGLLATLIFTFAIQIFIIATRKIFSKERTRLNTVLFFLTGLYCFSAFVFYFSSLSFKDMFPGFLLTPDRLTWIDKNANIIGFIGFVLAIIPLIYKGTKWMWRGKKVAEDDKAPEH